MPDIDTSDRPVFAGTVKGAPVLRRSEAPPPDPDGSVLALRRFHFVGASDEVPAIAPLGFLPALLYPFRDPTRVRSDYPLFLSGPDIEEGTDCEPLRAALARVLSEIDAGQILRDNATRLEVRVRSALTEATAPVDARSVLAAAAADLRNELGLTGESAKRLEDDLDRLIRGLPAKGGLLAHSTRAPLQLFLTAAQRSLRPRRAAFRRSVEELCAKLESTLQTEHGKDSTAHDSEHVGRSVGSAGMDLIDPDRLAQVVGEHRGTKAMSPAHRARIEDSLDLLQGYLSKASAPEVFVVGTHAGEIEGTVELDGELEGVRFRESPQPCRASAELFDRLAAEWSEVFVAFRRARLALDPAYDPERDDAWTAAFGWESFRDDELHLLPAVLAIDSASHLGLDYVPDLSRLLLSGRRVHVLLMQNPSRDPAAPSAPGSSFRLELAYLGMGHREAFVQQSTAARPELLMAGFRESLAGTRAALTVIDASTPSTIGAWLTSRAAVEARAHPLFRYDPEAGSSWARRLEFSSNPSPTKDWSSEGLEYATEDGEPERLQLSFTFADFALLDPDYAGHFAAIPPGLEHDDLCDLLEYLDLPHDAVRRRLPFIWAVDETGELQRLIVTLRLVRMVQERLGYWRTLQDLAGVRSETVDRAVAAARAEAEERLEAERTRLASSHDHEVAEIRSHAATDAMQGLAQMLLDTDIGSLADVTLPPPSTAAGGVTAATPEAKTAHPETARDMEKADDEVVAEDIEDDLEEGYVDTVLCTSCNDCVLINAQMFVYDDNKQVYLADASAGTFRQLVEAAEKCPAKCIHPGMPLDANEPGVDDLIARAKRFN